MDYFVDCIEQKRSDNISSFAEALKTDITMEQITKDAARSLAAGDVDFDTSPILPKTVTRPSMWRRLFRAK